MANSNPGPSPNPTPNSDPSPNPSLNLAENLTLTLALTLSPSLTPTRFEMAKKLGCGACFNPKEHDEPMQQARKAWAWAGGLGLGWGLAQAANAAGAFALDCSRCASALEAAAPCSRQAATPRVARLQPLACPGARECVAHGLRLRLHLRLHGQHRRDALGARDGAPRLGRMLPHRRGRLG